MGSVNIKEEGRERRERERRREGGERERERGGREEEGGRKEREKERGEAGWIKGGEKRVIFPPSLLMPLSCYKLLAE